MELYTWEYEGRKYYGFMRYHRLWGKGEDDVIEAVLEKFTTNLRPAKVVGAGAVVIAPNKLKIIKLAVKEGIEGIDQWRTRTYPQSDESVKARGAFAIIQQTLNDLNPTPPVTEPKKFGAIVEAQYIRASSRTKFFFNGIDWIRERTLENFDWSDLINPTILSEGLL